MSEPIFIESQKFTRSWFWLLLLLVVPVFFIQSIIALFLIILVISFLFVLRLDTRIDKNGVSFKFFPFVKKKILWSEISSAKVVDYGFVGGWGIRIFTAYGTVYNVRGSKGLALELVNGKKICIGTQKPEELKEFLSSLPSKNGI